MGAKRVRGDTRINIARYQVDRLVEESVGGSEPDAADSDRSAAPASDTPALPPAEASTPADPDDETNTAGQETMEQFAQYVEISIQQAMRRGDFDNLPGAGKPIPNLTQTYDPDWWVRRKIEREQLTGLGPPALTLRTEDERLDSRLDGAPSEQAAREILEDFNRRVIEARRQLLGGPPVITRTRDVEVELQARRERRDARVRRLRQASEREAAAIAELSWWQRRRAARGRTARGHD